MASAPTPTRIASSREGVPPCSVRCSSGACPPSEDHLNPHCNQRINAACPSFGDTVDTSVRVHYPATFSLHFARLSTKHKATYRRLRSRILSCCFLRSRSFFESVRTSSLVVVAWTWMMDRPPAGRPRRGPMIRRPHEPLGLWACDTQVLGRLSYASLWPHEFVPRQPSFPSGQPRLPVGPI